MNEPNYFTCACQHCSGHLKFDANQLRPGETRRVECPHCHLETVIFFKAPDTNTGAPAGSHKINAPEIKSKSSKIELFLFELTRFPTVVGAILVLLAMITAALLSVQAWLPAKTQITPVIAYEMVAPAQKIAPNSPNNAEAFIPKGAKMAKKSFPQPVTDFLLKHEGFSLKEWLDQLNPDERQAFLDNLAVVLVTANSKQLNEERMAQLVRDYAELWTTSLKYAAAAREKAVFEKQNQFKLLATVAFGLFISLMILCLVLVLLAIERNTRMKPKEAQ